jgi:hypothetical protein
MRDAIGWLCVGVIGSVAWAAGCGSATNASGDTAMGSDGAPNAVNPVAESTADASGRSMGAMSGDGSGRAAEGGSTGASDGSTNSVGTDAGNADSVSSGDSAGDGTTDSGQSVDAGSDGDADSSGDAGSEAGGSLCAGGMTWPASDEGGAGNVSGAGTVEFQASTTTQIVELKTTLTVPTKPASSGTLFLWPGLQPLPNGQNYNPIGEGVLQPVLTWGRSCAPNSPTNPTGWWISAQYVNTYGYNQGHTGCLGGQSIDVQIGDQLDITMSLKGTVWSQLVLDRQSGQMATYDIDMAGQDQNWAIFRIEEPTSTTPSSDVVFTSTTMTFAAADPMACQPTVRGLNDYVAPTQTSMDGTRCCVSRIILRAQGVPATTPNMP